MCTRYIKWKVSQMVWRLSNKMGLKNNCTRTRLAIVTVLLIPLIYITYIYHEYIIAKPFMFFEYPLEVNMPDLVKKIQSGKNPGVEVLNKHNFPLVFSADRKCKDDDGNEQYIDLLFVIKSAVDNFELRDMIRRTWGMEYLIPTVSIRRVFMVGVKQHDPDSRAQQRIGLENQQYGDIVQEYFIDHYYNNTLKLMMGFKWAMTYCRSARFLAFMDDDYYVNTYNVIDMLKIIPEYKLNNSIIGYIWTNAMPFRSKNSKWYISLSEYPYRFWPPYPTAGSFFISQLAATRLFIAMQYVKYLRFDDAFIGIAAWKLQMRLIHSRHLHFYDYPYSKDIYRDVIAAHGFKDPQALYKIFKEQMEIRHKKMNKNAR